MKKLALLVSCFASTLAFAVPSAPISHAPSQLIVHNKIPFKSVANRDGNNSAPALPWTTSRFPWQSEVVPFCTNSNGKIAKPCDVNILVLKNNGKSVNAGSLRFNVKNGKITIIPGDDKYQITVNGIGEATIRLAKHTG